MVTATDDDSMALLAHFHADNANTDDDSMALLAHFHADNANVLIHVTCKLVFVRVVYASCVLSLNKGYVC